ncbi:hypothetical protein GCM10009657_09270 [Oryzihumus leptocrescens]
MGSKLAVWTWYDVSPEDGCTLVPLAMAAPSLTDVARATSRLAHAQNRTTSKLLTDGQARKASGGRVVHAALERPGEVVWLDEGDGAGWTTARILPK